MEKFTIYTIDGKEAGHLDVPTLFQIPVDQKLIHRYVTWVRGMLRSAIAHTKTRGEVSGGGKKPWKQKGTGRARSGSTRNPIWRHGGTIFGPQSSQNFETRMPRQERRKAFMSALSAKAASNNIVIIDQFGFEKPKTKVMVEALKNLPGTSGKKVLHIHGTEELAVFGSTRNIPRVHSTTVAELNVLDVMNHDVILMDKDSVAALEKHFTPSV
ncbi:MAG TPA: 50S ribosomal protein L4 [Verrucomicrobiae bacterium]|nr:50S ribosomal protein L4 [Verrucomicrobiae bacterium]